MVRKLTCISYALACSQYDIEEGGVHKVTCGDCPGVLISPEVVALVSCILVYKFYNIPLHNEFDAVLVIWGISDLAERDRFYMMLAYALRGVLPDLWELPCA